MKYAIILASLAAILYSFSAEAHPRNSCECEQLQAIRRLLEHQFQVVCDERHCEPAGDDSGGGELP